MRHRIGTDLQLEGIHVLRAACGVFSHRAGAQFGLNLAQSVFNGGQRISTRARTGIEKHHALVSKRHRLVEFFVQQLGH